MGQTASQDDEDDDESLALRVAAYKDQTAATTLVTRYGPKLKGYLTKHFGDVLKHHSVEDAVQNAFVKMLKYIGSFNRKKATFEAWMIRLAYNVALDMCSAKDQRTFELFTDEPVFYPPPPTECEDDGKKDWRTKILDDFIENKLKDFKQAVAREYVITSGNIDAANLMKAWGKTRNDFDVAKCTIKKKFQEILIAAEKQRDREKGRT
jgi:RNA polymerase sigma factor (sigma-70 family)